jgi:hypothetical protein
MVVDEKGWRGHVLKPWWRHRSRHAAGCYRSAARGPWRVSHLEAPGAVRGQQHSMQSGINGSVQYSPQKACPPAHVGRAVHVHHQLFAHVANHYVRRAAGAGAQLRQQPRQRLHRHVAHAEHGQVARLPGPRSQRATLLNLAGAAGRAGAGAATAAALLLGLVALEDGALAQQLATAPAQHPLLLLGRHHAAAVQPALRHVLMDHRHGVDWQRCQRGCRVAEDRCQCRLEVGPAGQPAGEGEGAVGAVLLQVAREGHQQAVALQVG